ncbi:MAG: hypothetical protein FJ265_14335 [Planctomycetes bacterium]|nr:hypothetical protein [Planctomycetota bacterium]
MRRRTEHLVRKRDGRTEFLRATKLARSIHLALHSVGVDEDWRALELANVTLQALRQKRPAPAQDESRAPLTTAEIADAVQHLLVVTGQPAAAVAYGAVAAERTRRRRSLATLLRFGETVAAPAAEAPVDRRGRFARE